MDVVLYMRYSSDRQTEQSIEGQQRVCLAFCEAQGYRVVGQYIDRATSAYKNTEKRLEFNRMIRDSDRQQWQAVVVYKLDRFARNRYDSATYKAKLKKNGVRVISATENISDNPEGVILEAVLEGMAEFYSKELSQKINRGLHETAQKLNFPGGHIPMGYRVENKKLVIDEARASLVREAFHLYADGATVKEICNRFNALGYRTSTGTKFNYNSFYTMFRNERYLGIYIYRDVRVEGGLPAIIDRPTFETVARRLRSNEQSPGHGRAKVDYLLSEKLFCGHCGRNMVGESGTGRSGTVYHYYSCGGRKRHGSCDKKPLKKDIIEKMVVEDAIQFLTPDTIEQLAEMAVHQNRIDIAQNDQVPSIEKEIRSIRQSITNLLKMIERGVASDSLDQRLIDLEEQKKAAEERLEKAKGNVVHLEKEHIVWWLSRFCDGNINDEHFRRSIIDLLVNSVTVWDEPDGWFRITTTYNITGNNTHTFTFTPSPTGSDIVSKTPPRKKSPLSTDKGDFFYSYSFLCSRRI